MNHQSSLQNRKNKINLVLAAILLTALVIIAGLVGVASFMFVRQITLAKYQTPIETREFSTAGEITPVASAAITPLPSLAAHSPSPALHPTLTPWDGIGRVTVLVLGLDYRDWEAGSDYSRSDTMILLTLDPLSRTAGILSIPRDLWVAIPGFKHGKINTAYYLGDAYKLPGGGPGLAVDTVEQFLGVPINYYAQIDFGAFVRFIDEMGGVKINVPEPITIDLLGSGSATKKRLKPGVQVLPGEWALAYARARNSDGGDFDRAKRQQQVILAIRDRVLSFETLPVLLGKADILYKELAAGIRTNLTLEHVTKLALLASQIPEKNIRQGVINEKYILFGQSPDNLAILIPIIDKIHVLRDEIFADTTVLGPLAPGNSQERMAAENARVAIRNGSAQLDLAQRTSQYLQSLGVNVVEAGDSPDRSTLTSLIDYSGKPHTSLFLVDTLGISSQKITQEYDPNATYDILLILGDDWAASQKLP